ncbi:universal stress protein [Halovenus salina]|uniref:Universal stress protein n=1 Tax=Halovenus salina TaxID=1510225 RepID=A0ABD5VZX5_9EURY|nr:universal stress protein [Halovenus salina]
MNGRVLLPLDGNEHGRRAYEYAAELFPDATFVLLHVINPADANVPVDGAISTFPEGWYEKRQDRAEQVFAGIEELAAEDGIETTQAVELGKPTRKILDVAAAEQVDHIVMATHGRQGVSRLLLGSTAETVARCSDVPVTIAP